MKAIGSFTNRDVSRGLGDILPAAAILGNFDLSYKQNIFALMGGVDFGREAIFTPYDAVVLGLMGGYIDSSLNFRQSPTSFHFSGGTVGASLSYLQGGWFADGLFKADLLDAGLNFPSLAVFGITNSSAHATNIGGLANFGYRWDWTGSWGKWYAEPIATLSYVSTHIDGLSFPGLTASFPNGEAFRGALGLRLGDIWMKTAQYEIDSSVTGKVWDQFHTNNGVTLQSGGTDLFLDDRYQKVFGEVTGQLNVTSKSTGWSAFTNTAVQFNSQFLTVTGKGGARYQW
jgi:outer membrane autotransporter protein